MSCILSGLERAGEEGGWRRGSCPPSPVAVSCDLSSVECWRALSRVAPEGSASLHVVPMTREDWGRTGSSLCSQLLPCGSCNQGDALLDFSSTLDKDPVCN